MSRKNKGEVWFAKFQFGDLHQDDLNLIETKFMEYVLNHK